MWQFAAGFICGAIAIIWLILYELCLFFGPRSPRENDMLEARVIAIVIAVLALVGAAAAYREHVWTLGYNERVHEQQAAELKAVAVRNVENVATAKKNDAINDTTTRNKDEALSPVIRTIYVDRVRVGTAICGPAAPAKADDASGSDSGDTGPRLVSPEIEAAVRELDAEVEKHLATGRACQDWGKAHGFIP